MAEKKNIGVILAGGSGRRFGSALPKQYLHVNGKEVIAYVINAFRESVAVDDFFVVVNPCYMDFVKEKFGVNAIESGDERNITVFNALSYIREYYPDCEKVIFADSARPLIRGAHLDDICIILDEYDAVITTAAITDSLGYKSGELVNRKDYFLVQTPEAFRLETLKGFRADSAATAIIQQCDYKSIYHYDKIKNNFKVTYPDDLRDRKSVV